MSTGPQSGPHWPAPFAELKARHTRGKIVLVPPLELSVSQSLTDQQAR